MSAVGPIQVDKLTGPFPLCSARASYRPPPALTGLEQRLTASAAERTFPDADAEANMRCSANIRRLDFAPQTTAGGA